MDTQMWQQSYIQLKPAFPLKWMENWVKPFTQMSRRAGGQPALAEGIQFAAPTKAADAPVIDAETAKLLLEREGHAILDMRRAKDFEEKHIVKPANCSINVPCTGFPGAVFVDGVRTYFSKRSKILIIDDSGRFNKAAADALVRAGYTNVKALEGGFNGWMAQFTSTGRKQPPRGRWVSSGPTVLKLEDEDSELKHEELWAMDVDIDGV